jgi:hypothetical protein
MYQGLPVPCQWVSGEGQPSPVELALHELLCCCAKRSIGLWLAMLPISQTEQLLECPTTCDRYLIDDHHVCPQEGSSLCTQSTHYTELIKLSIAKTKCERGCVIEGHEGRWCMLRQWFFSSLRATPMHTHNPQPMCLILECKYVLLYFKI